jgi:protease-4
MTETYDLFTRRVTAGREGIDLSQTAEGRLFVGSAAVNNRMADQIGGVTDAIRDLATSLGLESGRYDVLDYPAPPGLSEILEGVFGSMVAAPGVGAAGANPLAGVVAVLKELVGPRAWPAMRDQMSAMMQLRKENVLLTSPRVLIFR